MQRLLPAFIDGPARVVAGVNESYRYESREGLVQQWRAFADVIRGLDPVDGNDMFGVYWNCDGDRRFDFLTGIEVAPDRALPPDWQRVELPRSRYAVFQLKPPRTKIDQSIDWIWRDWVGANIFQVSRQPSFEKHIGGYSETDCRNIELWIPVELPPLSAVRADITTLPVSAIVNAANERLLGGGGVDGAIHRAAGPQLLEACRAIPQVTPNVRCPTGEARITPGFRLPAPYVIHTVGPVWRGGQSDEPQRLARCYRQALQLAAEHSLDSIAFPAISCGVVCFSMDQAARGSVREIFQFQSLSRQKPLQVFLVAYSEDMEMQLKQAVTERISSADHSPR